MNTRGSVEIECPIEDVFRWTNENVADWSTIVLEEQIIDAIPDGPGTTLRMVTEENGQQMEFLGVVTQFEPPHASTTELTGEMFDLVVQYTFDDLGPRTRVTQDSHVKPKTFLMKLILRSMGWLMRSSSCKALDKELQSLKSFCEGQQGSNVDG